MTQTISNGGSAARRRWFLWLLAAALLIPVTIAAANHVMVGRPVRDALGRDPRNDQFTLRAHYAYYVVPSTLVLDLRRVGSAAPVDLLRGVFQAAEALHKAGRRFDRVVLARNGTPRFYMKGEAFAELGADFGSGENPVYLIRTFPEKLYKPDGSEAFGSWTGGLLGVMGRQMEDVNEATRLWIAEN